MTARTLEDLADLIEAQGEALLDLVAEIRAEAHANFPETRMMYRQNEGGKAV